MGKSQLGLMMKWGMLDMGRDYSVVRNTLYFTESEKIYFQESIVTDRNPLIIDKSKMLTDARLSDNFASTPKLSLIQF